MGYYTRFEGLDVDLMESDPESAEKFRQDAENEKIFGSYGLGFYLDDEDSMKWYEWESDCKALSLEYPNLLFTLSGAGEETGDIWKAWFRNGRSVVVKPKLEITTPNNLSEVLPLISKEDLEKTRLKAELAEAERRVAELKKKLGT